MKPPSRLLCLWACCFVGTMAGGAAEKSLGLFEGHDDIGAVGLAGTAVYAPSSRTYTITGGGENMWFSKDALHYVWKRATGDLSLTADIRWQGTGGNAHRKACLILRQSLDPDAAYADAVIHGDGLTSLQYRETRGGPTREIQSNVSAPRRLRLEKQGPYVSMSIAGENEELQPAGGSFRIKFTEPFYIGLGVCAHDNKVLETAEFSRVEIARPVSPPNHQSALESTLEIVPISSGDRRVVLHTQGLLQNPVWSKDGSRLVYYRDGGLHEISIQGGPSHRLTTGELTHLNAHHGLSPNGTQRVISEESDDATELYLWPEAGGEPQELKTRGGMAMNWHGWAPNGLRLAFGSERNGNRDIFTLPLSGGIEFRLTDEPGLDDAPDYSPDGRYLYFHSDRSGTVQIWRVTPEGKDPRQITFDDYSNWFPHPSPDGRWILVLSAELHFKQPPQNEDTMLRLVPLGGGQIRVLAKLLGGTGTMDMPCWSPDGTKIAFVSYRWR